MATLALVLCLLSAMPASRGQAALGAAGRPPAATPQADFDTLRRRADEARTAGQVGEAVELYTQAIAMQPSWSEGHWYLGTIYYDADRHRECRDAFASSGSSSNPNTVRPGRSADSASSSSPSTRQHSNT